MPYQPVPDTAEVVAKYDYFGTIWINTFYYQGSSGWTITELDELLVAVGDALAANLKPLLSSFMEYVGVEGRGLRSEFDLYSSYAGGAGVGGIANNIVAGQAAYCVTRYSALTGRSARGRVYLPSPTTNQLDSNDHNYVTVSYSNAVLSALQEVSDAASGAGWDAVIVSRVQDGVVLAEAETYPQTGWRVRDLRLDTQRRRLVGDG